MSAEQVSITINGSHHALDVEARRTLADVLREEVGLTGTHLGCEHGVCGACTILLDGRTVYACSVLAITAQGADIRTVEGLAGRDGLNEVQKQFVECDGLMCGFCTPGFVVSATALLDKNPQPSKDEIRRALDGNICRCGTQIRALEAVEKAAGQGQGGR